MYNLFLVSFFVAVVAGVFEKIKYKIEIDSSLFRDDLEFYVEIRGFRVGIVKLQW